MKPRRPSFTEIKDRRDSIGILSSPIDGENLKLLRREEDNTSKAEFDVLLKFLLLGDSGVGKSCFLLRFCDDSFTPSFISTMGIDFKIRTITVGDKRVKLQIWDTAGQERFRTITNAYYRGAMGVMIFYDITSITSFERARDVWIPNARQQAPENTDFMLIGHKCDLEDARCVTNKEASELAQRYNMLFCTASAKTDVNVDWAFLALAKRVMKRVLVKDEEKDTVALSLPRGKETGGKCCK